MDAFFGSLLEEVPIGGWVNKLYTTEITTTKLNAFLPGILGYYGDVPVAVHFSIQQLGNFTVTEANPQMGGVSTLTLEFWAQTSLTT